MSHWTKMKLQVSDQAIFVKALKRMGLTPEVGNFTISQYGTSEQATIRVAESVGFSLQQDGTYSMVGDFYHAGGRLTQYYNNQQGFQQELTAAYAVEDATTKLEDLADGWEIEENAEAVIGKDGLIRMVAVSYS